MQFLLTEDEKKSLDDKASRTDKAEKQLAQAAVAIQHMRKFVVPEGKCIHDKRTAEVCPPMYCDDCPLAYKNFDPTNLDQDDPLLNGINNIDLHGIGGMMCSKFKEFSK